MDKENSSKPDATLDSNSTRTPAPGSNFFSSVTHPSSYSRNKEDLFRRLRSGNDILCNLPSRLDPNIQFSEDEDSEEIRREKPEEKKKPSIPRSVSCQMPPSFKTRQPLLSMRKVQQTPVTAFKSQCVSSQSSIVDNRMKKIFPPSATKNRSVDLRHQVDGMKINLMSKPEFKLPVSDPTPYKLPSKSVSSLPEETVIVNDKSYRILSYLGSGGSCKVYSVYDSEQKSVVAVKCVDLKNADKEIRKGYEKEIEYLKQLQGSTRVIRMFDYQYLEHELFIVLEKGEIDLAKYLSNEVKKKSLSPLKVKFYWAQMLEAVSDIHKHGIVHSDLKPANFLLVAGNLKLIDFGIATVVPDDKTSALRDTYIGTLNYMSPEAVTQTSRASGNQACFKVSVKSDVWSLGCILYNLVYGETPFQSIRNMIAKIQAITNPDYKIEFKPIADKQLLDVMKQCLKRNPKERASVEELLQHPYLREEKNDKPSGGDLQSKDLENVLQQMQGLTPRRMNYISRVVQELSSVKK